MPTNHQESKQLNWDRDRRVSDLVKTVEDMQIKAGQHDKIRAMLIANFNKTRGEKFGLVLNEKQTTVGLVVEVLQHFMNEERNARRCLISDGDGHWFVAPAELKEKANNYFEKIGEFWDADEADRDGMEYPKEPEWLRPINGPHTLTFVDPEGG